MRDVGLAEELAQDALVAALERWPESGVPDNPGAWLMATAKHRAIDHLRHGEVLERKHEELGRELESGPAARSAGPGRGDGRRHRRRPARLVFTTCHPVLGAEARVALTLRLLGGLTTDEIARAFLVPEATVAQRIVRAKRTLAEAQVPFEVPGAAERDARLGVGARGRLPRVQRGLLGDARRRLAAAGAVRRRAAPRPHARRARAGRARGPRARRADGDPGVARRARASTGSGAPVLLLEQDRARWDRLLIGRGLAALERAERLGGALGPYALQGAIAACHARARTAEETDWERIAALYDALAELTPSPVVELNRAVALAMAFGPAAGLELVDALAAEGALAGYHLLPSVRGDLLAKLGRGDEARAEFARAAELTRNARERALLLERAAAG